MLQNYKITKITKLQCYNKNYSISKMQQLEEREFLQNREKNKQLLQLFRKLKGLQESCWGRFFRFEKSQVFKWVERRFSVSDVFTIRLDDMIYLVLLLAIVIVFCILPSSSEHILTVAYRQYLVMLYLSSLLWLLTPHLFKHVIYLLILVVLPALALMVFLQIIQIADTDKTLTLEYYLGYWSFWVVYAMLYLVYPLRDYVRTKIGSLYSYLFALSFLTLFGIWPFYSLIEEYIASNGTIQFTFITNNKPLLITFLIIIVFTFYLLAHNTFFEGDISKVLQLLRRDFTRVQLVGLIDEIDQSQSVIYRHYNVYSRVMSVIVFSTTLASEIYVFIYFSDNISTIYTSLALMAFLALFLVYGSIINRAQFRKDMIFFFLSILSLIPVGLSAFYYHFGFYEYIFLGTALPYATIFWSVIRAVPTRRPILRMNVIVLSYTLIHIPVIIFMLNSLNYFTTDATVVATINYVLIGIVGVTLVSGLLTGLIWLYMSVKQLPKDEQVDRKPVEYFYHQEGNPPYVPYTTKTVLTLQWLISMDLRPGACIFSMVCFLTSCCATMFVMNQLFNTFASTQFFSTIIRDIIYAQLPVILTFYIVFYYYGASGQHYWTNIFLAVVLFCIGVAGIALSYTIEWQPFIFRIYGGCCLVMLVIFAGFAVLKTQNLDIAKFVAPMLVMVTWIILTIPYVQVFPIVSVYVVDSQYGIFIYWSILTSVVLLILVISAIAIIFNVLMNKFQLERKIKFMTQDVKTYLNDEGVQANDQVLHILYESYDNRDKKYVYFLKKGFPVNTIHDQGEASTTLVTYDQFLANKKPQQITRQQFSRDNDPVWKCLTFCCGQDDDQIEEKLQKVAKSKIMPDEQLKRLLPQKLVMGLMDDPKLAFLKKQEQKKPQNFDPSNVYSSKTPILKNVHVTTRHLGDDYALLKAKRQMRLAVQSWHHVFNFISNQDYMPKQVIFNDLQMFNKLAKLDLRQIELNNIYFRFAKSEWSNIYGLNIDDFALFVEYLAERFYPNVNPKQFGKMQLLINKVLYNLSQYEEFQDLMAKVHYKDRSNTEVDNSPFLRSRQNYQTNQEQYRLSQQRIQRKKQKHQSRKLIQPNEGGFEVQEEVIERAQEKGVSCKKRIYYRYLEVRECCSRSEEDKETIKRKRVKPWDYLSLECVHILQQKELKWGEQHENKEYVFRLSFNNIVIALFKLADIYTYLEITIRDPQIGWIDGISFSILYVNYRTQLYIALALILITVPSGVYGIALILQDRLGLTKTRTPAYFPHPMFIFTSLYKILILSAFVTIAVTLLATFSCNWTTTSTTNWTMILEPSIQCFGTEHNIYVILSLVGLIAYYPLSAYTMPNFQFADKILDLKFRPSYLVIYFQVNFVLVAGKVLLSPVASDSKTQITFISINIASLTILALSVLYLKPCLIHWFNYIQLLVILIGLIANILGLVLYLTGQWVLSVVLAAGLSVLLSLLTAIYIKKAYFSEQGVFNESPEQVQELQMHWDYKNKKNVGLVKDERTEHDNSKKTLRLPQNLIRFETVDGDQNDSSSLDINNRKVL